ncbi:MAG TPA: nuclear transport factor 2 family protein [Acidothermaceae bacterium]|jgi:hypothetical protein|nr:nuclear transport factor 2 family protein [Acidothermaceae bacterium]
MSEPTLDEQAAVLLRTYCAAVDGHRLDQLRGLFAENGTFETRGQLMTADERDAFFTDLWATRSDVSTHVCRDVHATRAGDLIHIKAQLTASFILDDGSVRVVWGHYDDVATLAPGGLRFAVKQVNVERNELLTATA